MSRKIHLPKEIIDYIWSYDDRYKKQFRNCVDELRKYFYINRLRDHFVVFNQIYNVYQRLLSGNIWKKNFSQYHLERLKMYGCRMIMDNLSCYRLKNKVW